MTQTTQNKKEEAINLLKEIIGWVEIIEEHEPRAALILDKLSDLGEIIYDMED
jgi:hypothetical protein